MTDAPFEKSGNTTWAQCAECDHWFHVSPALVKMATVSMICPGCRNTFLPMDAKTLVDN
ncbi:MAG: hypothetical protein VYA17_05505 [Pseudomonadota bacterium]|nr:hypothetical protein [Pseudomonadota bacterium]